MGSKHVVIVRSGQTPAQYHTGLSLQGEGAPHDNPAHNMTTAASGSTSPFTGTHKPMIQDTIAPVTMVVSTHSNCLKYVTNIILQLIN